MLHSQGGAFSDDRQAAHSVAILAQGSNGAASCFCLQQHTLLCPLCALLYASFRWHAAPAPARSSRAFSADQLALAFRPFYAGAAPLGSLGDAVPGEPVSYSEPLVVGYLRRAGRCHSAKLRPRGASLATAARPRLPRCRARRGGRSTPGIL